MRLPVAGLLRNPQFWYFVGKVVFTVAVEIARVLNDRTRLEVEELDEE